MWLLPFSWLELELLTQITGIKCIGWIQPMIIVRWCKYAFLFPYSSLNANERYVAT